MIKPTTIWQACHMYLLLKFLQATAFKRTDDPYGDPPASTATSSRRTRFGYTPALF
jgi:hypothetical protein